MPDARNRAFLHQIEKLASLFLRHRRRDAVGVAVQNDGRDRNGRLRRQGGFERFDCRIARRITVAMPVRMDCHVHEIRVVPRGRGLREGLLGELPMRGPQAPQQAADLAPVCRQAGAAALQMEVVLIPLAQLLLRCRRHGRIGNVLDVVAVAGDERAHALGPQRGGDARGAPAPVVADQHRLADVERIHQLPQVVAERGLLPGPRRVPAEKAGRPEAAQIGNDGAAAGADEPGNDVVIDARTVRPAMHQEDRLAAFRPAILVDDIEDGCRGVSDCCGHTDAPM